MKPPTLPLDREPRPLGRRERFRLNPVVHELWCATQWIGLRDRLRCPTCRSVGTYKPHGDMRSRRKFGDRPFRRWLCKYCGRYEGKDIGIAFGFPDPARGAWAMPRPFDPESPEDAGPTPHDAVVDRLGRVWPWNG